MYYILALLGFGVLIIVHEFGHFTLAKLNGVKVEEFSIGMGPKILSHQGKETKYSLGLFPIGGYVRMLGEEEASDDERSFSSKSPLRRISIIIAGAFMNLVLAVVIFTVIFTKFGYAEKTIKEVRSGSPAEIAGLMPEDEFLKVDGSKVFSQQDVSVGIVLAKDKPVDLTIDRNGEEKTITVTPEYDEEQQSYIIGITFNKNAEPTIFESFKHSFAQGASLVSQVFKGFGSIIKGEANLKTDVGGPVTIVKMSASAAKTGIWTLVNLVAVLSVSIAVFNLLPLPALDGGWTVLLLIELITRRKVPDKIVNVINTVGFMFLIGLMVLVTVKDIIFPMSF